MEQNEKKKMSEKKSAREVGWATAHFQFMLGHDTANNILKQGAQGRVVALHDPTTGLVGPQHARPTNKGEQHRARAAWLERYVVI